MELEDRRDHLRLLALVARGLGATGLDDYEPPSVQIAEDLRTPPEPDDGAPASRDARELEVLEFMSRTGGELGAYHRGSRDAGTS